MHLGPFAAPDPFRLLAFGGFRPVEELQIVQEPICVGGDAAHPLAKWTPVHWMSSTLAATVDHLFVGQHGAEFWAPVHRLFGSIGEPAMFDGRTLLIVVEFGPRSTSFARRLREDFKFPRH